MEEEEDWDNNVYVPKVQSSVQCRESDLSHNNYNQMKNKSESFSYQSDNFNFGKNHRNLPNRNNQTNWNKNRRGNTNLSFQAALDDDDELIDWNNARKMHEQACSERYGHLPALIKDIYNENTFIASMTPSQVEEIRLTNNNIVASRVFDENPGTASVPNPITQFEHCFADYPDILGELKKNGFSKPSPIQCQSWPILLRGEDMIGIAQTGTGKTLAFLLPALLHTEMQPVPRKMRGGPNVLVIAPTRELALQIEKEVSKYNFRNMRAVCLYGGGDRQEQIKSFKRGVEIIIATPGRLNDLIAAKILDVRTITYLVLDEADRMLDMGFEPQIRKTMLDIRPDRQTVMTSATWPTGIRELAKTYMKNPIQVYVGSLDLAAVHSVKQIIELVDEEDKYDRLLHFVSEMTLDDKLIIFCGRKVGAEGLSCDLTLRGIPCQVIHGNREQSDREQALDDIKTGVVRILIATDLASRGLDIEDLTHVINYDFPRNIEEYVHRVGRTGRAGRLGTSLSFFARNNWGSAADLIAILEEAKQEIPDELHNMADRFKKMKERTGNRGGRGGRGGNRYNRF